MRTIVDIPNDRIQKLDAIGKREDVSRAELMRRAVDLYLEEEKKKKSDAALDQYFGYLKDAPGAFDGLDGVSYQVKMRSEWNHRDQMYSNWGMNEPEQGPYEHKPDEKS